MEETQTSETVNHVHPKTNLNHEKNVDEKDERIQDEQFGAGSWRPQSLQCFASLWSFMLLSCHNFVWQASIRHYASTQVSTIENYFHINSATSGLLLSATEIGSVCFAMVGSHFGKYFHIPRLMSVSSITAGLAAMAIAVVQLASPESLPKTEVSIDINSHSADAKEHYKYLCWDLASVTSMNKSINFTPVAGYSDLDEDDHDGGDGVPWTFVWSFCFLFVSGAATSYRAAVQTAYIEENVMDKRQSGKYLGMQSAAIALGYLFAMACGGLMNKIPVDLEDSEMQTSDPRWMSAWWLGFAVLGFNTVLTSLPLLCMPRYIVHRKPDEDKNNQLQGEGQTEVTETTKIISSLTVGSKVPEDKMSAVNWYKSNNNGICLTNGDATHITRNKDISENAEITEMPSQGQYKCFQPSTVPFKHDENTNRTFVSPGKGDATKTPGSTVVVEEDFSALKRQKFEFGDQMRDLPRSLRRIFSNPVVILTMVQDFLSETAGMGMLAFLLKYLQDMYDKTAATVTYSVGGTVLTTVILGALLGGYVTSRFHLSRAAMFKTVLVSDFLAMVAIALLIPLNCDNYEIVGFGNSNNTAPPEMGCTCTNHSFFVCGSDSNTYLSPCFAGCKELDGLDYKNCSAIGGDGRAVPGFCDTDCFTYLPALGAILFYSFVHTFKLPPNLLMIVRSVGPEDASLVSGLLTGLFFRLAGAIGPLIYGKIYDTTCLLWPEDDGACKLSDKHDLSHVIVGISLVIRLAGMALLVVATVLVHKEEAAGLEEDEKVLIRSKDSTDSNIGNSGESNVSYHGDRHTHEDDVEGR